MQKEVRSWSKPFAEGIIGRKKVDWSIFEYGTHIPIDFHDEFASANANHILKIGEKASIELIINNNSYEAQLINSRRKDSEKGSLQLRYDQNTSLKKMLIEKFQNSYRFLKANRDGKSKRPIHTPKEIEEYLDIYQTETPYVYRVELHSSNQMDTSFWWVNQGQTHREEKENGFLWAPQKSKQGIALPHHVNLIKAKVGDVVFCYSAMELRSIGIVKKEATESPKPAVIEGDNWEKDGYLVELDYYQFNPTIRKDEIPNEWRLAEGGPFDRNGNVKQGYFFSLTKMFSKNMFNKFKERFPTEVRNKMLEYEASREKDRIEEMPNNYLSPKILVEHIYSYITTKGFFYSIEDVKNLFLSIKAKPFVIISGISGTGKTKIIQLFSESVGATEKNGQFTLIPVRPDWSDGSDLIGYKDIKGDFIEGPLTKVMLKALDNPTKPYFVLLDEMNLARVEYYFSDLLSVMESRDWKDNGIVSSEILNRSMVGRSIGFPENMYIIGTVNMDETTHPFSKKVLDRANTIEFNRVKLDYLDFLQATSEAVEPKNIENDMIRSDYLYLKDLTAKHMELIKNTSHTLVGINEALKPLGAQVGYRVRDEICMYLAYNQEGKLFSSEDAFDYCLVQKILPRISGSDSRVEHTLKELFKLLTNQELRDDQEDYTAFIKLSKYPRSTEKLVEMYRRLTHDGFTSFWIS
ncbi:McrB family protein [Sutcliffiella sp. NPDC057660]|uniref:McrB family protein n=1 Tax=Sutcliffiella sp. NPDC057660 TaxID=3346199 RepID=UPI0036B9B9A5